MGIQRKLKFTFIILGSVCLSGCAFTKGVLGVAYDRKAASECDPIYNSNSIHVPRQCTSSYVPTSKADKKDQDKAKKPW